MTSSETNLLLVDTATEMGNQIRLLKAHVVELKAFCDDVEGLLQKERNKVAELEKELSIVTSDRNGLMVINEKHRLNIAELEPTIKVLEIIARSIGSDHAAAYAKQELNRLQKFM